MTTYHRILWDYREVDIEDETVAHYPVIVVQHGIKKIVLDYIKTRFAELDMRLPPVDKERSDVIDETDCGVSYGGPIYQAPIEMRWRTIKDLISIEVGSPAILKPSLQKAIKRADDQGHPDWVWVHAWLWRFFWKRTTAEKILRALEEQADELNAWEEEYDKLAKAAFDKINEHPGVLLTGGTPVVQGPSEAF